MQFKRIEPEEYKFRRLQVSEEIRLWAKTQIMHDSRPYKHKARIQDIFLHLITEGLKVKKTVVFENKYIQTKIDTPTNVTKIPTQLHEKIEKVRQAILQGKMKKKGEEPVDSWNVIMCLIEAGYRVLNPTQSE